MQPKVLMEWVSAGFEGVGVLVIIAGFFVALALAFAARRRGESTYATMRAAFGKAVLLGLEILVAADLIRTVTVTPTLTSILTLGMLVIIRTFLSWSFEIELEGIVPWRRHELQRKS